MNKKELFLKHLDVSRDNIKDRLFYMLNGESIETLSSRTLQNIADDLKEIELLQDFLNSTDFEKITE